MVTQAVEARSVRGSEKGFSKGSLYESKENCNIKLSLCHSNTEECIFLVFFGAVVVAGKFSNGNEYMRVKCQASKWWESNRCLNDVGKRPRTWVRLGLLQKQKHAVWNGQKNYFIALRVGGGTSFGICDSERYDTVLGSWIWPSWCANGTGDAQAPDG